jgi:peptidyl-prolyl cis-trans isomerase B (cyclophilin B)
VDGLAHLDPDARAAALRGLAAAGDPADFALLMEAYERAQEDDRPDAALAAIDALAALGRGGLPVARAFQLRFARHPDPAVQARAQARLGEGVWGPPDVVDHDRGSQYYGNLVRSILAPAVAGEPLPQVEIRTAGGVIRIELAAADAPRTVQNFLELIRAGYFESDGDPERARWHRVVPNFVLQDGDSRGDGSGGPGHTIRDEVNLLRYSRGMVGMAHAGPHTAGGQFFITHSPQPHLDGAYTIFGRVVSGMDVADGIVQDDPIEGITIVS